MGVGKTTVGKLLAKQLGKTFMDADAELEERTGVTISTIFDIEGEEGFRRREAGMLQELSERDNIVLATGGGAILDQENRRVLRKNGTVVYLEADMELLLERTRNSRNRPLLETEDREAILGRLMEERDPLYRAEADVIVRTGRRAASSVAKDILGKLDQK
jgi:shikimate kinase|tara:strand:+ start:3144 stop:3626 length:483 start_codon:yes stop_codon:yes gene_type:complete